MKSPFSRVRLIKALEEKDAMIDDLTQENLNYISHLKREHKIPIGYSGHEKGIQIPVAAVALGAQIIEKHITLDTNMEGTDHKASITPKEFEINIFFSLFQL